LSWNFSTVLSSAFVVGDEAPALDRVVCAARPVGGAAINTDIFVMPGITEVSLDKTEAVNRYCLITLLLVPYYFFF